MLIIRIANNLLASRLGPPNNSDSEEEMDDLKEIKVQTNDVQSPDRQMSHESETSVRKTIHGEFY
uniref:Ovule protein n=1 Tax=Heterorhabditis bacteriophora TaxID=37862 RepID=A0A1I7XIL4_HETBA